MTLQILYEKLIENNFDEFAYVYAITPDASTYHDTLISTVYKKQNLQKNNRQYHQFINFLVNEKPTLQLLCLMVEQEYYQVIDCFDNLSLEEKTIATARGSALLDIAIEKKDKKLIKYLLQYMKPSDYLYPIMSSNFEEIKYSAINRLEKTKENTLYVLTLYLDKSINAQACSNYLLKYYFDNLKDIVSYKKEYHSYPKLNWNFYKTRKQSSDEIKFMNDFTFLIDSFLLMGQEQPNWYHELYSLQNFNYDISRDAQNLYLKIALEENLNQKQNKKAVKI